LRVFLEIASDIDASYIRRAAGVQRNDCNFDITNRSTRLVIHKSTACAPRKRDRNNVDFSQVATDPRQTKSKQQQQQQQEVAAAVLAAAAGCSSWQQQQLILLPTISVQEES